MRRTPPRAEHRGSPSPSRMTTTRSKASATNRMSWLMAMTVRPAAAALATISRTRSTPAASWPVVGSSRTRTGVPIARTDASARSFRLAPPRSYGLVASSPSRPVARRARPTASRRASAANPTFRAPNSTSPRTEPAKICRSGSWNTSPTRAASWATVRPAASTPSTSTRPDVGRSSPFRCRTSVVLPLPFCPTSATRSPGPIRRSTPSSARTSPSG